MSRLNWLLPLALVFCACPPPIDLPDGGDGVIVVPAGEGVIAIRSACSLNVPAGAFAEETRIFLTAVDNDIPEVPMRKRVSRGCKMQPTTLKPSAPLTIIMTWDAGMVPPGVDTGTFDLRRQFSGEAYTALPGVTVVPAMAELPARIEAKTDKPGTFWVTSPSEPNIARVELTPEEVQLMVGQTQQFSGRVVSPTGDTIDAPITWTISPPRVGSIDDTGLVTALDPGIATVTASAGMQSASAKVYVQGNPTGPVTFSHQNPFPTGNDLYAAAITPLGTVYAGDNGTVLLENAMSAWSRVGSIPSVTLKAVGGTTLENAVAVGQTNGLGILVEFHGAQPPTFRTFGPTQISDLTHLWFDGTHGMGVGIGNELVIYRNGMWTTEYHPSFEALLSVIGDGAGGFTVVGDLGSIYRWDPTRKVWDSVFENRLSVKLEAGKLVDFATGEAWAVGANRLWHFVGTGWVSEALPATPALLRGTAVEVIEGNVTVAGELKMPTMGLLPNGRGLILQRVNEAPTDGGMAGITWRSTIMRGQQIPQGITASGTEAVVVGTFGAVWRWNSTTATFTETSKGFQGDVADLAVTDTDVFAAVNECDDVRCLFRRGMVMHQGMNGWEALGGLPITTPVFAIAARANNEVIVSTTSSVWVWSGSSWTTVPVGSSAGAVLDMRWCGTDLWAVGDSGGVYRGNSTLLNSMGNVGSNPLYAIHCGTDGEIWVAGTQTMANRPANGQWTQRVSSDVTHADWRSVWSPGAGEGFAFGDAQYGVYWDTATLLEQRNTGQIGIDVATAMWGTKIDNLYMTGISNLPGIFGFMMRFDGISWQLVDSGAHRRGTAIIGRSDTELWTGTEGGGVLKSVAP
ncbi:MAG: Ig-like domain-containing protein [Archangium sp.]